MPLSVNHVCDAEQGYNGATTEAKTVGHIEKLKIGEITLNADQEVPNPEDLGAKVKVVAVLSSVTWDNNKVAPIQFTGFVSEKNRSALEAKLTGAKGPDNKMTVSFTVYNFDSKEKKEYKAFHSDGKELPGLVEVKNGNFCMEVRSLTEDESPVGSRQQGWFYMSARPADDQESEICLATSATDKFVNRWGHKRN